MDKSSIQSRGLPPLLPSLSGTKRTEDSTRAESTQRQSVIGAKSNRKLSSTTQESSPVVTIGPASDKETISMNETETVPPSNSHFLQGFRLESCKDVLSIPDPPSPTGKISSRRFSLPSSQPLRNISNASDVEDEPSSNTNTKVTTRKKRTRKSLAHVVQRSATPVTSADTAPSHNPLMTPVSSKQSKQLVLTEDECEGGEDAVPVEESSAKRRKKRQSIMLPSDLEPTEDGGANDDYVKTYATFKNNPSPPATPARETKTPTKPLTRNLHDLRKLVHEYTLQPKEQRNDSMPAKEILATTGYHLRSDPLRSSGRAPSELTREEKINAFMKLGPDLQKMDACKVSDAKMVAQVTQCKPQKLRGGYYKYFHSESGRPVSPEEFEERYLLMLEEVDAVRSKAWVEYFDKLRGDEGFRNKPSRCVVTSPLINDDGENDAMEDDEDEEDLDDDSSAGSEASSDCGEDDDADSVRSEVGDDEEETEAPGNLLPLPSRDEEPENPRIAQAQKKLFRTIDRALEIYSEEVLAAQHEKETAPN